MRLIGKHYVELEDGRTYCVALYEDRAFVWHGRSRFQRGSKRFRAALERLRDQSDPGSLTREHMAQCPDSCDDALRPVAGSPGPILLEQMLNGAFGGRRGSR